MGWQPANTPPRQQPCDSAWERSTSRYGNRQKTISPWSHTLGLMIHFICISPSVSSAGWEVSALSLPSPAHPALSPSPPLTPVPAPPTQHTFVHPLPPYLLRRAAGVGCGHSQGRKIRLDSTSNCYPVTFWRHWALLVCQGKDYIEQHLLLCQKHFLLIHVTVLSENAQIHAP